MKANGIDCCHGPRQSRRSWSRGAAGGALVAVLAALTPKCPMCIAAWFGVIGLSGLEARIDPRMLWLMAAVAVAVGGPVMAHRLLGRGHTKRGVET